ncbi:MAG TPA: hypothetical protein VG013_10020 [Gemmataceae bacterium]|nr:hypothetical protein [Gemmataceae bacterium]
MAGQSTYRQFVAVALALGSVAFGAAPAAADILRVAQNEPGDSKPIILYADAVSTWIEGGRRVILLKGAVLIEHDVIHARMQGGVAWVDEEATQRTGIVHVDIYAEGEVRVENGATPQSAPAALLELNTRGELKLKAQQSKVSQQPQPQDPLYLRAAAARPAPAAPSGTAVQRTSASAPPMAVVPVQMPVPAPGVPPAGEPGAGPSPVSPPPSGEPLPGAFPPPVPRQPAVPGPASADPLLGPVVPFAPPSPGMPAAAVQPPQAGPVIVPPAPPPDTPPASAPGPPGPAARAPERQFQIAPRNSAAYQQQTVVLPSGEQALVVTGGVILTVRNPTQNVGMLDIEADRLVVWTRGSFQQLLNNLRGPQGHTARDLDFYLAGDVELREQNGTVSRTIRAEEVYYDVSRNVAVAYKADLEFKQPGLPDPLHVAAEEVQELSPTQFRAIHAEVFSSRLPSDPGLKIVVAEGTLDETHVPKRTIFGRQYVNRVTGQPETEEQRLFRGEDMVVRLEDFPVFYFPFIQGDANDPLGPLRNIRLNYNRIFGFQALTTWNVYDLIGIDPIPGTRWDLDVDYLSARGPAVGTSYDYAGNDLFGLPGKYMGLVKAYGIEDTGTDILGGGRGANDNHPTERGRFLWRQTQQLPDDFTLQFQISALSDQNFLEQYFQTEFERDINQETFVYLKQQRDTWAWTVLAEPRIRPWVTETEWLPRADGYLIGESPFGFLTYTNHTSAGYAQLRASNQPPPFEITDRNVNTARFDTWNELSLPFSLGPVRVVPYLVGDLTFYTEDLAGNDRGRVYGAAGLRASMPLTRLYPDVHSDLLNLDGINHKIVASMDFYTAHSDRSHTLLPQLDRLNDDATDQSLRDIKPLEPVFNPQFGTLLATSPLFDPQAYAIRRLAEDLWARTDTLDTVEVVELDLRQRLQTKRGYPGAEHIVDWMTLDVSASVFPEANRDNFGENLAFINYDWTWNIGDRTALVSTGWFDPIDNGARVFTIGAFLNRPDRTSFYLGYRQIDPLESKAVTAAVSYVFSPKYAVTGSSTFDFGTSTSLSNSLVMTRMGSDLQLSVGITYNAILNTFGVVAEIVPNIVAARIANAMPAFGSSLLGR